MGIGSTQIWISLLSASCPPAVRQLSASCPPQPSKCVSATLKGSSPRGRDILACDAASPNVNMAVGWIQIWNSSQLQTIWPQRGIRPGKGRHDPRGARGMAFVAPYIWAPAAFYDFPHPIPLFVDRLFFVWAPCRRHCPKIDNVYLPCHSR